MDGLGLDGDWCIRVIPRQAKGPYHSQSDHWHCTFCAPFMHLPCTSRSPSVHLKWISLAKGPHHSQSDHWHCTFRAPPLHLWHTFCTPPVQLLSTFDTPSTHLPCTLNESHWLKVPTTANQIIGIAPSVHLLCT